MRPPVNSPDRRRFTPRRRGRGRARALRGRRAVRLRVPAPARRRELLPAHGRRSSARQPGRGAAGPILDLACGTGRLTAAAAARRAHGGRAGSLARRCWRGPPGGCARLSPTRRGAALLVRGRPAGASRLPAALRPGAVRVSQRAAPGRPTTTCWPACAAPRPAWRPSGWLAFDLLPPDPAWIAARSRTALGPHRVPPPGHRPAAGLHHQPPLRRRTQDAARAPLLPAARRARARRRAANGCTGCATASWTRPRWTRLLDAQRPGDRSPASAASTAARSPTRGSERTSTCTTQHIYVARLSVGNDRVLRRRTSPVVTVRESP